MSEARKEYLKQYREANKEKLKDKAKQYREANKEKAKQYREANKEKIKEIHKKFREANKEKIKKYREAYKEKIKKYNKEYQKQYREANKEKIKENRKQYREANKEKIKEINKKWNVANKEKLKKYREANKERANQYYKERLKTDPLFKMKRYLRSRTRSAFKGKGYKKSSQTHEMLGVDWEVCKAHIERQFKKGMKWSNHGEWHIDHIIPLASAKNEKELIKLCYYRNLQPLWAFDNMSKSAKIIGQQSFMRI